LNQTGYPDHVFEAEWHGETTVWDAAGVQFVPSASRRAARIRRYQRVSMYALVATVLAVVAVGGALALQVRPRQADSAPARRTSDVSRGTAFPTAAPGSAILPTQLPTTSGDASASATAGSGQPAVTISRLVVPIIGVDAPVEVKGLDARNAMQTPDEPFDVAWYDFSALPGSVGNAVFAGHVDHRDTGPAIFWDLGTLTTGDVIAVYLADGRRIEYQVTAVATFDTYDAPVHDIIGPTTTPAITLITCAGTYDAGVQQYDQRLVVRAELLASATP
jgi:sortase (surface protein transpeptidase)